MKVIFYVQTLNHRGTTTSILDFAKYNQEILGNESVIVQYAHTEDDVVRNVARKFKVRTISSWAALDQFASGFDLFYAQKAGMKDQPFIRSTKSVVHAVFQYYDPHEDRYAYISEWLSDWMVACGFPRAPWVPLMVDLPQPDMTEVGEFRKDLGISKDQFVYGRLGGYETFDLPFVQQAIIEVVETGDDIVFFLPNTKPFYQHKNIIYTDAIIDRQLKSNYIGMCDAMIHGREMGESFGLAMMEFLFHDKPVLAWEEGNDRNHVRTLQPFGTLYNESNIFAHLLNVNRPKMNYAAAAAPFTPEKVMKKFEEVFIQ